MPVNTRDAAKVAVAGAGYWGKNLVRNYADMGVLGAICDSNVPALDSFRNGF